MKTGKLKKILLLVFIIIAVIFAYNLFKVFTTNKQILDILTTREISLNGKVEAIVGVKDAKTNKSIKSKVTVQMKDSNNKKVKNFKESFEIEEGENANISAALPQDLNSRKIYFNFYCKIWVKNGYKRS